MCNKYIFLYELEFIYKIISFKNVINIEWLLFLIIFCLNYFIYYPNPIDEYVSCSLKSILNKLMHKLH